MSTVNKKFKKVLKTNKQSQVTVGAWNVLKGEYSEGFCYSEKTWRSRVPRSWGERWPERRNGSRKGNVRDWKRGSISLSWAVYSTRCQGASGNDDQAFRECLGEAVLWSYHRAGCNLSLGGESLCFWTVSKIIVITKVMEKADYRVLEFQW